VRSLARGRSYLAQASPYSSLIRGADGGAAHCGYEHEGPTLIPIPVRFPAGDRLVVIGCAGRILKMEEVDEVELVVDRVAALDLGPGDVGGGSGLRAVARTGRQAAPTPANTVENDDRAGQPDHAQAIPGRPLPAPHDPA
jgi:hypothetical protein